MELHCCPTPAPVGEYSRIRPNDWFGISAFQRCLDVLLQRRRIHPARDRLVSKRVGGMGVSFSPAASTNALTAIRRTTRSWSMHRRSDKSLDDLARMFNSHIPGGINYYGLFFPSACYPTLQRIDLTLARWASGKFKSLRGHKRRSRHWLARIARHQPRLFAHWGLLYGRGRTMGAGSCESITSGS